MKHRLNYAEIYITNVCNYSCTHCQSLNNFAFKGHQRWQDYQHECQALSKQIDITQLQIIGGEPTLNPDFEKWVLGISELWPDTKLQISTNGSRLDKLNSTIYQILSKHKGTLWITCHDMELYDKMLDFSKSFLNDIVSDSCNEDTHSWKTIYNSIKELSWPDCDQLDHFADLPDDIKKEFNKLHKSNSNTKLCLPSRVLIDKNGVEVIMDWSQTFVPSAITPVNQQLKISYNSDPNQAHKACGFKTCHQINKGKLYQCPLVSVLPDFLNQFDVSMDANDQLLASSYKPMSSSDDEVTISNFINTIDQPIPQCKFCPANYNTVHPFVGTDKKIKLGRP